MTQKTFKLSESFKKRADTACFWEAWVAAVLSKQGFSVSHTPFLLDGVPAGPDLEVRWADNYWPMSAEVKSRNLVFYSAKDYPKDPVLVCSYNSWVRKRDKGEYFNDGTIGCDFFLVSCETGAIVWVPRRTIGVISEAWDPDRGELYSVVTVAKSELRDLIDFVEYANV